MPDERGRGTPPATPCGWTVTWAPDRVTVHSVNRTDSRLPAVPGRGLTGMRHRAELLGGTFQASTTGGRFDVRVTIPSAAGQ